MLDEAGVEQLARLVQITIEREIKAAMGRIILAQVATVATTAELGVSPFTTRTGPNGAGQNVAAVWLSEDRTPGNVIRLPVRPGETLTEGCHVRITFNRPGVVASGWIDGKV